ncbi:MAG: hypothetical protein IAF38_14010 [Bacteroidia bacterium]|nr:hypothetical protein [Bacteroidia bacterium]
MKRSCILFVFVLFFSVGKISAQVKDTIFYMNGTIIAAKIIDTLLNAVTYKDPADSTKNVNLEDQAIFAVKYAKGAMKYYYTQDTLSGNWFTRDEMWYFVQGERDARKGFRSPGAFWGGVLTGIGGGCTGALWGPAVPFAFMGASEITKIRIRHKTVSNPYLLDHDAYILGYQREAVFKRRMASLKGGGIGLVIGFSAFFLYLDKGKFPWQK